MITRITGGLLVGLLVLVLWHIDALAQQRTWERLQEAAIEAYQIGDNDELEKVLKESLQVAETFGPDDPRLDEALGFLAGFYFRQGKYAEAVPPMKRLVVIREKALGPEHPDVALVLNNLAYYYRKQGNYAEAEPLFKRSLAIIEKVFGPEHPNVAQILENYAVLLRKTRRASKADSLEARAMAIRAKHK